MPNANDMKKPSNHIIVATKSSEAYYIDLIRAQTQQLVQPVRIQQGSFGSRSEIWVRNLVSHHNTVDHTGRPVSPIENINTFSSSSSRVWRAIRSNRTVSAITSTTTI